MDTDEIVATRAACGPTCKTTYWDTPKKKTKFMQTLKVEGIMRIKLIAVLALFVTMSAACMAQSPAQTPAQLQTTNSKIDALRVDLQAAKTGLLEDSGTLVEIEKGSLGSTVADNANSIVTAIQLAMTETDAALWFIAPYTQIGCDQDRELMKAVLQNRLKFYSHLLDLNMTSISEHLAYTTAPAASQVALRAQDRMRNAKRDMQSVLDLIQWCVQFVRCPAECMAEPHRWWERRWPITSQGSTTVAPRFHAKAAYDSIIDAVRMFIGWGW